MNIYYGRGLHAASQIQDGPFGEEVLNFWRNKNNKALVLERVCFNNSCFSLCRTLFVSGNLNIPPPVVTTRGCDPLGPISTAYEIGRKSLTLSLLQQRSQGSSFHS